jgi:FkbM family methyltransferase
MMRGFTVLQIGGRGGADPFTQWLRRTQRIVTIGVEPESSGNKNLMVTRAYDYIVTKALSDTVGTAVLYLMKARGWCSLRKPDTASLALLATPDCLRHLPFQILGTENVEVTRLDEVSKEFPAIDYMQIDVQGSELDVLNGAIQALKNISVIELEVHFHRIYENEALFPTLHEFFVQHGYILFMLQRQGEREFGKNYVEANAFYYNSSVAKRDPSRMSMVQNYAEAKTQYYSNRALRLLCDIERP